LQRLFDYEVKINALLRRSRAVIPVHLRKLPVASPLSVASLASYRLSDQVLISSVLFLSVRSQQYIGGTAAAAPPPFRPSDSAPCGSCPL